MIYILISTYLASKKPLDKIQKKSILTEIKPITK